MLTLLSLVSGIALAQEPSLSFEVHGALVVGSTISVSIEGATPGQDVFLLYSETEGTVCPARVAPTCIGLVGARILRHTRTEDGSEFAQFVIPDVADGMYLQVATDTEASNVVFIGVAEPDVYVNDG